MAQVKRVKSIEEAGQTAKGTPYWKVTWDDDRSGNIFDISQYDILADAKGKGVPVKVAYEQKGKFWNITSVTLLDKTVEPSKTKEEERSSADDFIRASIETQVAAKIGAELLSNKVIDLKSPLVEAVIMWCLSKIIPKAQNHDTEAEEIDQTNPEPPPMPIEWANIRDSINKLYTAKLKGWGTVGDVLAQLEKCGANISSKKVDISFNTMSPENRAKFASVVNLAICSSL